MGSFVERFELDTTEGEVTFGEHGKTAYRSGCDAGFDKARELLGVVIWILFFQGGHVVGHVQTEDMLAMNIGIELLALAAEAWKSTSARRNRRRAEKQSRAERFSRNRQVHQTWRIVKYQSEEMTEIE